jgi:hypothetical protein
VSLMAFFYRWDKENWMLFLPIPAVSVLHEYVRLLVLKYRLSIWARRTGLSISALSDHNQFVGSNWSNDRRVFNWMENNSMTARSSHNKPAGGHGKVAPPILALTE